MMTTAGVAEAVAVLLDEPSALLTDIDGTISRIVARPEDATVDPAARRCLEGLARRLTLVAAITGRDAVTARAMVGADGVQYVGNYGLEPNASVDASAVEALKPAGRSIADGFAGATFEDKGATFCVHYRNCADPDAARHQQQEQLEPEVAQGGARLLEGKRVLEVAPLALPDKRSAIESLVAKYALRGIVYLGDDVGDIVAFREIRRRRDEEGLPGLGLAVVDGETDANVKQAADALLDGVDGTIVFLEGLLRALEVNGRSPT